MTAKSSQLQIRVSPDEKAALKRLARAAGESISSYVLSRVLPSTELQLAGLMDRLRDPEPDFQGVLTDLARALNRLSDQDFAGGVPAPDADISLGRLNRVAALVEAEAARKGVEPPVWAWELPLLERPQFWWALASLKPHQMRVTPVAFKRRNVFFDPASGPAPEIESRPMSIDVLGDGADTRLLGLLDAEARSRGLTVELYLVGGAVLVQGFEASPSTANVTAMFRPTSEVMDAIRAVAKAEGVSDTWHHGAVRRTLTGAGGSARLPFVELPHVHVFEPLPEYVLALKCAAMRVDADATAVDDSRYLMRAMNLTSAAAALAVVGHYFTERQLPDDIGRRIERLSGS